MGRKIVEDSSKSNRAQIRVLIDQDTTKWGTEICEKFSAKLQRRKR